VLEARALLMTSQLAFMSACAVAAAGTRAPTRVALEAVPAAALAVTSGSVLPMADGGLAIRAPSVRAVADGSGRSDAELDFLYLGPSRDLVPLASGEARRQIGLKLRAQDTCNVIYVMWHIEPTTGIHVALKLNPGQRTHAECSDRGYQTLSPTWPQVAVPAIRPGERRRLRATIEGDLLRVSADGVSVWTGRLPSEALALDGPVGLRTDNANFDLMLRAAPGRAREDHR
jgi:hypothetical protein